MNPIAQGYIFAALSSLACIASDVLTKQMSISIYLTLFYRFFFSFLLLLAYKKANLEVLKRSLNRNNWIRGLLFGVGMTFFLSGLKQLALALVILINFCTPIFTIILSKMFLREDIKNNVLSAVISTFGILVALSSSLGNENSMSAILCLLVAGLCFAITDTFNKIQLEKKENIFEILLGSSLCSTLFFGFLLSPTEIFNLEQSDLIQAFFMGITAICIPLFMLKASSNMKLSSLQPIKYIEFPISILCGIYFFNEIYPKQVFIGFFIIFLSTAVNVIQEKKQDLTKKKTISRIEE